MYVSLRDRSPLSSPVRHPHAATTDLVSQRVSLYSVRFRGRLWVLFVLVLCVCAIAFLTYFFVPRTIKLDTTQMNMSEFVYPGEHRVRTHAVAKLSLSNPNFVVVHVESIAITFDYLCYSCNKVNARPLGGIVLDVGRAFAPRTSSATLPLAFDFVFAIASGGEYDAFRLGIDANCTRDHAYFIEWTAVAQITHLAVVRHIASPLVRTRTPCGDPSP